MRDGRFVSSDEGAAAVILAAGASVRLGEPKQLVRLCGERLLERAVRVAAEAGCEPVMVVLGAGAERIAAECRLGAAGVVVNADWAAGMGAVRAGGRGGACRSAACDRDDLRSAGGDGGSICVR